MDATGTGQGICDVTTPAGTAGLEALSGSPGRGRSERGAARLARGCARLRCSRGQWAGRRPGPGRCWSRAGLRRTGTATPKSCTQALRTRVSLSAACQDTPGTLLSCFPAFKHNGLFLLYFSTLFCADKLTTPLCSHGKLRRAAAPGADSLCTIPAAHPHHVLPSAAEPAQRIKNQIKTFPKAKTAVKHRTTMFTVRRYYGQTTMKLIDFWRDDLLNAGVCTVFLLISAPRDRR